MPPSSVEAEDASREIRQLTITRNGLETVAMEPIAIAYRCHRSRAPLVDSHQQHLSSERHGLYERYPLSKCQAHLGRVGINFETTPFAPQLLRRIEAALRLQREADAERVRPVPRDMIRRGL
jgi:hypothetical protein